MAQDSADACNFCENWFYSTVNEKLTYLTLLAQRHTVAQEHQLVHEMNQFGFDYLLLFFQLAPGIA